MSGGPRPVLNPQQAAVVARTGGATFVTAGAGSGKTKVLAERFASIVLSAGDEAERAEALRRVLVITFTDKAAGELGERVRRVLLERGRPDLARLMDEAWISTIHGFCGQIVRRHALEIGVDPGFSVIAEPQTGVVRQQAFEEAASALFGTDAGVAELIDAHGVAAVRQAVASGLDTVRAMGRDGEDLRPPEAPEPARVLKAALRDLPGLIAAYADLPSGAVAQSNLVVLTAMSARLQGLAGVSAEDLAGELVALAGDLRFTKPGRAAAPVPELTFAAMDVLDALVRAGVETLAARHAAAYARLVRAYADAYESRKRALGGLDFEDLQLLAARLLEERPALARRWADRFIAVMVDEFQDTNDLQMRVITPVADGGLCVVGDEKQSIYGFRHADVDIFHGLGATQREADPDGFCPLQTNYRSHPDLLATFNAMFGRSPFFPERYLELLPGRDGEWKLRLEPGVPRTEVMLVDRAGWEGLHWREAEADLLARRIAALVGSGAAAQGDIVVLLRQMTAAGVYVGALRRHGLRVYAESSGGFFAAPEVADVRALLAVLANPRDGEAAVALLAGGLGGVSDDALYRLARSEAASAPEGVWGALRAADSLGLADADVARCGLVFETVERLRAETGRMRLADVLLDATAVLGAGGGCLSEDGAWANLRKVARIAADFERVAQADPAAFLRHLDEREAFVTRESAAPMTSEAADCVRVMTVHAAKGLEFPVVAVADLGHGSPASTGTLMVAKDRGEPLCAARLPKLYGEDLPIPAAFAEALEVAAARSLEEEKRVFYVACTRAEELLILSGGARLDALPGASLAIDWVRAALGSGPEPALPGVAVATFTAADNPELGAPESRPAATPPAPRPSTSGPRTPPHTAPRAAERRVVPPTDLSYTALALYERCPFRFFAERVLGVGTLEVTDLEGGPRGLGLAVHSALQLLAQGSPPDAGRLDALARANRLDAAARARLEAAVEAYRASPTAALMGRLDAKAEVRFAVGIPGGTLVGTIDLLARDGERAVVADYKTGEADLTPEDARLRFTRQADVYALALLRSGARAVEVRFIEVEREGRETVCAYDEEDAERLERETAAVFARIAAGEFDHLPSFAHDTCRDCPVSGSLCPVVRPRTKERRAR